MDIFISWSGKRGKASALALSQWLRTVNHYLHPWMSDKDLKKGDRWLEVIGDRLADHQVGIVCVTPENADSPWLLFEAGALSKALGRSRVCPLLLGMLPSDIDGPLSQFQATTFSKEEMFALLVTLNEELKGSKLEDSVLRKMFDKFWPDLEAEVLAITRMHISSCALRSVVDALSKHGFPQPSAGRMACFAEGFESHKVYELALTEARERV